MTSVVQRPRNGGRTARLGAESDTSLSGSNGGVVFGGGLDHKSIKQEDVSCWRGKGRSLLHRAGNQCEVIRLWKGGVVGRGVGGVCRGVGWWCGGKGRWGWGGVQGRLGWGWWGALKLVDGWGGGVSNKRVGVRWGDGGARLHHLSYRSCLGWLGVRVRARP